MKILKSGPWYASCLETDGARLHELQYRGRSLLTRQPGEFQPPSQNFGSYERRPVYGYDDCFPTVDPCLHPQTGKPLADHGELCWLPWQVEVTNTAMTARIELPDYPLSFLREMQFQENCLIWSFQVENRSPRQLSLLQVMHPLLPLDEIAAIWLPACGAVVNEDKGETMAFSGSRAIENFLMNSANGREYMLLLRDIEAGHMSWQYREGLTVQVEFPLELFPTVGIWWNRSGFPPEPGKQRNECALEPIPGSCSNLEDARRDRNCLTVQAGDKLNWQVTWKIS